MKQFLNHFVEFFEQIEQDFNLNSVNERSIFNASALVLKLLLVYYNLIFQF
jgi:hypothetical protein